MKPLLILGAAGTIGRVIASDWIQSSARHNVILADRDQAGLEALAKRLGPRSRVQPVDLRNPKQLVETLKQGFLVINSTSHHFNLPVMEASLQAGCHYLDLGGLFHFTRRQLKLHHRFAEAGLTAILGMGCAPGLTNLMARELTSDWEKVESLDIRVAGVDHNPASGNHNVPYAYRTILEELTLKPALFDQGKWTYTQPRSGVETYRFPEPVGTQTLFYTLHSEVATLPQYFKNLDIERVSFRIGLDPDLCHRVLNGSIPGLNSGSKKRPHDEEIALVEAIGTCQGKKTRAVMSCLTRSRGEWSAGHLNTACPASVVAEMLQEKAFIAPGVHPPENIIPWNPLRHSLEERDFVFHFTQKERPFCKVQQDPILIAKTTRSAIV